MAHHLGFRDPDQTASPEDRDEGLGCPAGARFPSGSAARGQKWRRCALPWTRFPSAWSSPSTRRGRSGHRRAQRRLRPHRRREGPCLDAVRGPPVPALPARSHDRGPSRGVAGADGGPDRGGGSEQELHLRRSNGEWRVLMVSAAPLPRVPGDPGRPGGRRASRRHRAAARRGGPLPARAAPAARHRDLARPGLRQEPGIADPLRESRHAAAIGKPAEQVIGHGATGSSTATRPRRSPSRPTIAGSWRRGVEEVVEEIVPSPGRQPGVPLHQDAVAGLDRAGHRARRHRPGHHPAKAGRGGAAAQRAAVPDPHRDVERHAAARRRRGGPSGSGVRRRRRPWAGARGELLGSDALDLVHPEDRGAVAGLPGGLGVRGARRSAPGPDAPPGRRVSRRGRGGSRPPRTTPTSARWC